MAKETDKRIGSILHKKKIHRKVKIAQYELHWKPVVISSFSKCNTRHATFKRHKHIVQANNIYIYF